MSKKLSEKLYEYGGAPGVLAGEAEALEERVAKFSGIWESNQQQLDAAYADVRAANARAKALEERVAECERVAIESASMSTDSSMKLHHATARAEAAEAQLEYVRNTVRVQEETAQELEAELLGANARADAAGKLAAEWERQCGERNALWRKAADKAEAAEAEVARLRRDWDEEFARSYSRGVVIDALRADATRVVGERDMFAADCTSLRVKLEKVEDRILGGRAMGDPDQVRADIRAIIDGEGGE